MAMNDVFRYTSQQDFPYDVFPQLSDSYMVLSSWLRQGNLSNRVISVAGTFPSKYFARRQPPTLDFFPFTTNRTAYAAIREVEDVFAQFYLATNILPYLHPLPATWLKQPNLLPDNLLRRFRSKGALLYASED